VMRTAQRRRALRTFTMAPAFTCHDAMFGWMNDPCGALAVSMTPCVPVAQMYERVLKARNSCLWVFLFLFFLIGFGEITLHLAYFRVALYGADHPYAHLDDLAITVAVFCVVTLVALTLKIRRAIKSRDKIPTACAEDLCCSLFPCFFFSLCQMMRYEGLRAPHYDYLSSNGKDDTELMLDNDEKKVDGVNNV